VKDYHVGGLPMKISPKTMAAIYFVMGVFFIYIAILSAQDTIWNITTMVLALFATLEFGVSIRLVSLHFRIKKNKKE
jgi:hypothetical protein